jgi:iron complex transport system permease protein
VLAWTLGNLSLAGWGELTRLLPWLTAGVVSLWALGRGLDALQLGEETASTLGVPAETVRLLAVVASSLATGASVAFVGTIGFVGLVAPHVMRRLAAPTHRVLVPASALGGALLLVVADMGARLVARPAELPVGIVLTLMGGPVFLWLLRRR